MRSSYTCSIACQQSEVVSVVEWKIMEQSWRLSLRSSYSRQDPPHPQKAICVRILKSNKTMEITFSTEAPSSECDGGWAENDREHWAGGVSELLVRLRCFPGPSFPASVCFVLFSRLLRLFSLQAWTCLLFIFATKYLVLGGVLIRLFKFHKLLEHHCRS